MPHLVSGKLSIIDLTDTVNYPVDNYIDIINNEIGQELGKYLKHKYNINQKTKWTADFTCKFLNEIQDYYAESFDIQIKSYKTFSIWCLHLITWIFTPNGFLFSKITASHLN